jgi:hypothetical protein
MIVQFTKGRAGKHLLVLGALASTFLGGGASAATQGTLGATSTGNINISASVPNRARLGGLADVSFLNQDPGTAALNSQNVCVWSNTATKAYTITATGNGGVGNNQFKLTSGANTVDYTIAWSASTNQTTGTSLTSGTASAAQISTATNQTCASGPSASASLIVGIDTANLGTMAAGSTYTGILTLLVTPQ